MAGRFVRSSKYRHVFGKSTKKEQCYDNLHISKNAWDSNIIKVNPKYLAVNWESGGGGAFAVIPLSQRGRLPEQIPLFRGHTAPVLDTDWSPFNDSLIASGSDDGKVFIWTVPEDFSIFTDDDEEGPKDVYPVSKLAGHTRKVGHVLFHPAAENVLATSSNDYTVKLWDVNTGSQHLTLRHNDIVQSMSYSTNGALLVTTCRDKKLRVWDLRQEKVAQEVAGHTGAKNSRTVWLTGEDGKFATTGFSKMSDRQLGLWDLKTMSEGPVGEFQMLDAISGVCMPFWDEGTKCLYLAGKGDGNIRYFEYVNDDFIILSEYKSADPQRGVAFLPKRGVSIQENEVMRAFKTVNDSYIEPVSFIVPRRAETFQSDIYPPDYSGEAGLSAEAWFNGGDADPPKFDLETLYTGGDDGIPSMPAKLTTSCAPAAAPKPISIPEQSTKSTISSPIKETPAPFPVISKEPEHSLIATEKLPSPIETSAKVVDRPASPFKSSAPPTKQSSTSPIKSSPPLPPPSSFSYKEKQPETPSGPTSADLSNQLAKITSLLEIQNETLNNQNEKIAGLTKELDALKDKVESNSGKGDDESSRKDEIIRKLELELEEARS